MVLSKEPEMNMSSTGDMDKEITLDQAMQILSTFRSSPTFARDQENSECICCRATTGIEWCLEDLSISEGEKGEFTIDLRRAMNDVVRGVSEMDQIHSVLLTIQILLRSREEERRSLAQ